MVAFAAPAAGAEDKLLPVFGEVSDDLSVFADGEFGFFGFSLLLAFLFHGVEINYQRLLSAGALDELRCGIIRFELWIGQFPDDRAARHLDE